VRSPGSRLVVLGLALGLGAGCRVHGEFSCERDEQCTRGGVPGTCETTGYCSYADTTCPSGQRYDDVAGAYDGQCTAFEGDAQTCYGTGLVMVCVPAPPTNALALTGPIDTAGDPRCDATIVAACTMIAGSITIDSAVVATGARPLVLVAATTVTIGAGGTLDVSSHRAPMVLGAGADPASCEPGTNPTSVPTAGAGGWGGSFGGAGGNGGNGDPGGVGGTAPPSVASIATLRGGCPGSDGAGMLPGAKGHGGGAVYAIAGERIEIVGAIDASGSAASGAATGNLNGGGGGGGSGGMIGLDAPIVDIAPTAWVFANGGGGGEGAGASAGMFGGESAMPASPGIGGAGMSSNGGDGGDGAAGVVSTGGLGKPATLGSSDGGGGGGGGAGVVKVFSPQATGTSTVSPPPT
jgi:hypothetical protein